VIAALRRRLAVKLIFPMLLGVTLGFSVLAALSAHAQAESSLRQQSESAHATAAMLAAGVRNSMLTGNGITVRSLLDDAKSRIDTAEVRIYAASGEEVFGETPPAPPRDTLPAFVRAALDGTEESRPEGSGVHAFPIENEPRCRGCHADGELRGVLTLASEGARVAVDGGEASLAAIASIARAGFVQIMTAKHEDRLDAYFADMVARTPGIEGVAVYSTEAERSFGTDALELGAGVLERAVSKEGAPFTVTGEQRQFHVIPLKNEPRCQGCHDADEPMRGAMVVAFAPPSLEGERTLFEASRVSLQHVMLSGLGRMVTGLLDEVRESGTVTKLALYDREGRTYHDAFAVAVPPANVAAALSTGKAVSTAATADEPEFVFALPLANDEPCQSCHGLDRPLRGVIEVRVDATRAAAEVRRLKAQSLFAAVGTVSLVTGVIILFVRKFVLYPIGRIGAVAERVGRGRFDAHVEVRSEDEMGRLGHRMNDMIVGLRQKIELSKFVSKETLKKVESHHGEIARGGVRGRVTVLFSDVRGFTSFSETRQPEEVVEMLNRYLQAQADVVTRHGGDIDKFVGDELMARFDGPDMEARATRCAVEMLDAVDGLNASLESGLPVHVGVGVNVGEVVLGAMGSAERMDFTVIGDAVNLGARLCSAAQKGEVIVSAAVRDAVGESPGLAFEPLEPIQVKGKKDRVAIFRARKSAPSSEG
jgi:class 3 adenylate cyclase